MEHLSCVYNGNRDICSNAHILYASASVRVIPSYEFSGYKQLQVLNFTNATSLVTIQAQAFSVCTSVRTLLLPPNLEEIADSAFLSLAITELWLPASLVKLATHAFENCRSLGQLTADPAIRVSNLDGYVFAHTNLSTFAVWKSLKGINAAAFSCTPILEYTNAFDNQAFQIKDGVIYQGTTLVAFPGGRISAFVVPSFVETIDTCSFEGSRLDTVSFEQGSHMRVLGLAAFQHAKVANFQFPDSPNCTEIGPSFFYDCKYLRTLTISPFISSIGKGAFKWTQLSTFSLPDDHQFFALKDGILFSKDNMTIWSCPPMCPLERFVIPKEVTMIKNCAFDGVAVALSFENGSQLTTIEVAAFYRIGQKEFAFDSDCTLESIPADAFGRSALETISFPRSLKSVEGSAFSETKISWFEMPTNATALMSADGVLYSKDGKTLFRFPPMKSGNYVVPASVESIGDSAFATCQNIDELRFDPNSNFKTLSAGAFKSSSVTRVVFPQNGQDVSFSTGCFVGSKVVSVTLPGKMKTIRGSMFSGCGNLVEVILPESIQTIESNAFFNCQSLASIKIPQFAPISQIGKNAFTGARALTQLALPYRVTEVDKFALPPNLQHITLYCPPNPSVLDAIAWLPLLNRIDVLCGINVNTIGFASHDIVVTHICDTNRQISITHCFKTVIVLLLTSTINKPIKT